MLGEIRQGQREAMYLCQRQMLEFYLVSHNLMAIHRLVEMGKINI